MSNHSCYWPVSSVIRLSAPPNNDWMSPCRHTGYYLDGCTDETYSDPVCSALLQVFAVMTTDAIMGTNSQNQVDDFHPEIVYNSTSGVGLFHTVYGKELLQSRRSTLPSLSARPVEENFEFFVINLKLFPLNLTFTRSPYHHTSLLPLRPQPTPRDPNPKSGAKSRHRRCAALFVFATVVVFLLRRSKRSNPVSHGLNQAADHIFTGARAALDSSVLKAELEAGNNRTDLH